MVQEAAMEERSGGLKPAGEGWFVVNAREAQWVHNEKFGAGVTFEGDADFPQVFCLARPDGQGVGVESGTS